ncbi:hypothetical protein IC229_30025 [Spirosoma sp. BT702]|uniref:Uncharacterized protein n=1 Tax=Spirosoma profusum TaxID=2771354 RepID=A0A927AUZ8_9BACT|nr:hypothetical protein [Spirosoma profusum]MBD2704908.1 hypothetical protein [Spirosoma profusum]
MKLISSSGSLDSFELSILGYGTASTTWRDRNRLQCRVSTFWRQKSDTQSAPLQTWEVKRLLSGLRSLWNKAANRITFNFSEPGLSMEAKTMAENTYQLQIQLGHSLKPAWDAYPDVPIEVTILLDRNQLQEAIQDLSGQVATYPER